MCSLDFLKITFNFSLECRKRCLKQEFIYLFPLLTTNGKHPSFFVYFCPFVLVGGGLENFMNCSFPEIVSFTIRGLTFGCSLPLISSWACRIAKLTQKPSCKRDKDFVEHMTWLLNFVPVEVQLTGWSIEWWFVYCEVELSVHCLWKTAQLCAQLESFSNNPCEVVVDGRFQDIFVVNKATYFACLDLTGIGKMKACKWCKDCIVLQNGMPKISRESVVLWAWFMLCNFCEVRWLISPRSSKTCSGFSFSMRKESSLETANLMRNAQGHKRVHRTRPERVRCKRRSAACTQLCSAGGHGTYLRHQVSWPLLFFSGTDVVVKT